MDEIGIDRIRARIDELGCYLTDCFSRSDLPPLFEAGHAGTSGIWTFTCPQITSATDIEALRARGLSIAGVGPNYARMALADRNCEIIVRISTHYFNTEDDLRQTAELLADHMRLKGH